MSNDGTERAQEMLTELTRRHGHPARIGCSLVAHRFLGFCTGCVRAHERNCPDDFPAATELSAWRLLAMTDPEEDYP